MNDSWTEVTFYSEILTGEEMLALIYDLPFDSFDTEDDILKAYIKTKLLTSEVLEEINEVSNEYPIRNSFQLMPDINWNEVWESQFNPVHIPGVCIIHAEFHTDIPDEPVEICITPKMAFGTGHHGTTSGMLKLMSKLNFSGKSILDFGSGTGILAIYSSKKGASSINAIDIEANAVESIEENKSLNHCQNIDSILGDKSKIPIKKYDIILANVTKNVILDALPELSACLKPNGKILFSGFFYDDLTVIESQSALFNLHFENSLIENGWAIAQFKKS